MPDVKTKLMISLAFKGLEFGLKKISAYMHEQDFKEVADKALNAAEGYFKEGSYPDEAVEIVCAQIRVELGVADSDPDN